MAEYSEFQAENLTFRAKHYLACAGDRLESCFLLRAGLLTRERLFPDGRRQIVGLYLPGDICGLSALADGRLDHDLVALSPVSCVPVARALLSSIAVDSARIARAIWREMSREIAISDAWTTNIGQRPAYERMAHFLCELEARLCASGCDPKNGLVWPGTQADLSALTGLSLVHVNRTLRQLERDSLWMRRKRDNRLDVARLRVVADFDPTYLALERETLGSLLLSQMGDDPDRSEPASRPASYDRPAH